MHPVVLICIVLAILMTVTAIVVGIKESDGGTFLLLFFVGTIVIVGAIGFGLVCGTITWNQTYEKLSPDKVETFIFNDNGIVASAYGGTLYTTTDIQKLNAVNNIDYYMFVKEYNAYNVEIHNKLYPVEKGKIDDYIKEK